MKELTGNVKTTIIGNDELTHVYEITKEFADAGAEVILLTLYPTITDPNTADLSTLHMLNHCGDEGLKWSKVHFVYLFSKVAGNRLSTRGLTVDTDNLEYLRKKVSEHPDAKIVISFGNSMEKCPAAIESKVLLFQIIQELRPNEPLWQLDAEGMEEEAPHILFAGIRYGDRDWSLRHYIIPKKYTPEGYDAYLACKELRRERFIKTVLEPKMNKKGKAEQDETEPLAQSIKPVGKKKRKATASEGGAA